MSATGCQQRVRAERYALPSFSAARAMRQRRAERKIRARAHATCVSPRRRCRQRYLIIDVRRSLLRCVARERRRSRARKSAARYLPQDAPCDVFFFFIFCLCRAFLPDAAGMVAAFIFSAATLSPFVYAAAAAPLSDACRH